MLRDGPRGRARRSRSLRLHLLSRKTSALARAFALAAVSAASLSIATPAEALTITEIMYNPSAAAETEAGGANLEWFEIFNDEPTVLNLSGFYVSEGVQFIFPYDTYLEGRSYLVVCADAAAVRARYGIDNVIGDFSGRLENNGERLTINIFGGGPEVSVDFSDRGQWPKAADGTGHSLVLKDPYAEPDDNDNWTWSVGIGGTPGRANFDAPQIVERVFLADDLVWRYRKNTSAFPEGWNQIEFDDSTWLEGQTGIGFGDNDDRTVLDDMVNNYVSFLARRSFTLTQEEIDGFADVSFQVSFDDGFVAFLNGVEIARWGVGTNPGDPFDHQTTSRSHEARGFESFPFDKSRLRAGTNVLAVSVHNATMGSTDASFIPRLADTRVVDPNQGGAPVPVVINECLMRAAPGEGWVELYNTSYAAADLSRFYLSDDPSDLDKFAIPVGTAVPARGFVTFTGEQLGFDFAVPELSLFLTRPNLLQVVAAAHFENPADHDPTLDGTSDARYPDGGERFFVSTTPTPGAANDVALVSDVVIHEIMYNPPREYPELSYIELFNRGAQDVDVSGFRFSRGVSYTFPQGTVLGAGEFLVVAENPDAVERAHGITGVLGPYSGVLSRGGELLRLVDRYDNLVDEVRYHDGGRWPKWADGGGSSLELIDPYQDNSVASAWEASDESGKSDWFEIEYSLSYTQVEESEFVIRMLAAAEVLVDDIRVTRAATQYIRNGDFETDTSTWRIEGNHIQSRRTTEDSFTGSASLKIVATGGGDTRVNRVEADTSPVMTGGTYTVHVAAKWLRGGNLILFSCFREIASCQKEFWLPIPQNLGTPAAPNSTALDNLGPVISEVVHSPAVPGNAEEVTVRARVTDSDGVASVVARYEYSGGTSGVAVLADDGLSDDGEPGDGLYAGRIPGTGLNVKVEYYVEAQDALGAVRREPREAPVRDFVYEHSAALRANSFTFRVVHDPENWAALNTRRLHSNELLDATFIFNEAKVYYNVGTRYRGSPWNRPGDPKMYRIRFEEDNPYRGRGSINLSRYGTAQNERAAYYSVWRNSTSSTPSPMSRSSWGRVRTTAGTFMMESIDPVNSDYLDLWFPGDTDGILMKITGKQTFDDSGNHLSQYLQWASYANLGATKAAYRWLYNHDTHELDDDFGPLVALLRGMNESNLATLDSQLEGIMDVEQFLRVYAARCAHDDWDTIAIGNGQNMYVYYAPIEGRWKLIPWDMDHTWGNVNARVQPNADAAMARIVSRPQWLRKYAGVINEMLNGRGGQPGFWSAAEIGRKFLDRNAAVVGADGVGGSSGIVSFINQRRGVLAPQVPARVAFAITTNSGNDLTVNAATTRLEGTGWVDIDTILLNGDAVAPTWTAVTRWRLDVPLEGGTNDLAFLAIDVEGNIVGADSITVTSTLGWATPAISAVEPAAAMPGEAVTIRGTEFHTGIRVLFSGTASTEVAFDEVRDPASLTAVVPLLRDGAVEVTVRNVDNRVSQPVAFTILPLPPHFIRGDANLDEEIEISDAVRIVRYLFAGLDAPCLDAADVDDDEVINVTDAVRVLAYLYENGTAPPAPFPAAGLDPDDGGALDCSVGVDLFSS